MHRPPSLVRRLVVSIGIPVLAFLVLAVWSFASPVGASPDDDFHLPSIWCGLGERAGLCENPGSASDRLVPDDIPTSVCFAFDPDISGACWDPDGQGLALVDRANADGLYPRVFYAVMGVFASPDVQTSVIVMRLLNSAFAVGLLTAVFWALPRNLRGALVVSVLATCVPLGLFVLGSTNPSSWAYLSAATVWITVFACTRTTGRRRAVLAGLAVLGTLIGAGARADAAVYAVFAVVLALLLGGVRSRPRWLVGAVAGVVVVLALALYFSAYQGGSIVVGMRQGTPPLGAGQIVSNALEVPGLWTGALGGWALGWLDTGMPSVVTVLSSLVFGGALFTGLRRVGVRRTIAVWLALLSLWVVPFVLLFQSHALVGELVQPRYILPLMVIAMGVASLRADAGEAWRGMRLALAGFALTVAVGVALHTNINRYVTGRDQFHINLDPDAEWWWTGAPSPSTTWIIGTLAFAGIFALLAVAVRSRTADPQTVPERDPLPTAATVPQDT